jgi:hypothetical protein
MVFGNDKLQGSSHMQICNTDEIIIRLGCNQTSCRNQTLATEVKDTPNKL